MEMETGCVLMAANVYPYLIYMMARAVVYTEINDLLHFNFIMSEHCFAIKILFNNGPTLNTPSYSVFLFSLAVQNRGR